MRFRSILAALVAIAFVPAQAPDFCGMRVYDANSPSNGAPTRLSCGYPATCSPDQLSVSPGTQLAVVLMGEINGAYGILLDFSSSPLCLNLGIPGLVNELNLNPSTMISLVAGAMTGSDGGRCNGGAEFLNPFFTIPNGLPPGTVLMQAVGATQLSAGGAGFALSNTVAVSF